MVDKECKKRNNEGTGISQPGPTGMGLLAAGLVVKKGLLQASFPHSDPEWSFSFPELSPFPLPAFQGASVLLRFPTFLLLLSPCARFD